MARKVGLYEDVADLSDPVRDVHEGRGDVLTREGFSYTEAYIKGRLGLGLLVDFSGGQALIRCMAQPENSHSPRQAKALG